MQAIMANAFPSWNNLIGGTVMNLYGIRQIAPTAYFALISVHVEAK